MTTRRQLSANNASSTLASDISSFDEVLTLRDASKFPTPGINEFFVITIDNGVSTEIVEVTSRSGNTLAGLTRAREGTNASYFASGSKVEVRITAEWIKSVEDLKQDLANASTDSPSLNNVSRVVFSDVPGPVTGRGLSWNVTEQTLDLGLGGTSVVLQIGQETLYRSRNNTGQALISGTVVMAAGTLGNSGRILITPAIANGTYDGKYIMGVVTEDIPNGADGFVTHFGKVRGVPTNGADVGEAWADGDILYAHPSLPGRLTKNRPTIDNQIVTVAIVLNAHPTNGTLVVRPTIDSVDASVVRYHAAGGQSKTVQAAIDEVSGGVSAVALASSTGASLVGYHSGTVLEELDLLTGPSGAASVGYDGGTVQDVLDAVTGPSGAASVGYTPAGTGAVATTVQDVLRRTVSVMDFGAKGDGIADDTLAIQSAINSGAEAVMPMPSVGYRTTAPLTVATGQKLIGCGPRPKILVDHAGNGIEISNKGHIENLTIDGTTAYRNIYTAVSIGSIGQYNTHGIVENVFVFYPKTGFHLKGGAYWYTLNNIDVYRFKDYGIILDGGPNNNIINFKQLASTATETSPGSTIYDWNAITWEQAAIKVNGNQNIFTGGEPAPSKWGVIVEAGRTGNRFASMYMEHQYCVLKAGKGSEVFWDCSAYGGIIDIDQDAIVVGPSGNRLGRNTPINTAPLAAGKSAKAIWFFDEGYGSTIYDRSGNGKNLTAVSPSWTQDGKWGALLSLDAARTRYINDIPLDTLDWSQPFTFAACMKIPATTADNWAITLNSSGGRYAAISVTPSYWTYLDYDGTTVTSVSEQGAARSAQDGYKWIILYFDPVNKTISNIDPVWGLKDSVFDPDSPRFSPWVTGGGAGITTVSIGRRFASGIEGGFSFVGLWQRKLTLSEATDLVNMTVPNLWPSAAPVRISSQADSTAADVATLKADFNALLAKMRSAGLLKT